MLVHAFRGGSAFAKPTADRSAARYLEQEAIDYAFGHSRSYGLSFLPAIARRLPQHGARRAEAVGVTPVLMKSKLPWPSAAPLLLAAAFVLGLAHAAEVTGTWKAEFDTQIGVQKYTF